MLNYPNILELYEVFDDNNYIYMITKYYDSENLLVSINKRKYHTLDMIRTIIRGIFQVIFG